MGLERFMAGWFATEMPRQGVRPCGLTPWEENATVVIYCGNQDPVVSLSSVSIAERSGLTGKEVREEENG